MKTKLIDIRHPTDDKLSLTVTMRCDSFGQEVHAITMTKMGHPIRKTSLGEELKAIEEFGFDPVEARFIIEEELEKE